MTSWREATRVRPRTAAAVESFHVKRSWDDGPPPTEARHSGPLDHLERSLRALEEQGLLRARPAAVDLVARSFCSNDYLALGAEPAPPAPAGAGASRLIVGERPEHVALESALASWLAVPSTLLFSSGYAANLGTLAALLEPGDLVVSDELNHASIIDGCRLSRARLAVVDHLSLPAVERALRQNRTGRTWVVTESYFSMDADSPDLVRLRQLCDEHGAGLFVDEAHALGVFGPRGKGICAERGVVPDVLVGTLGKAFGASGAFVAGSEALTAWLWNRARSFVFSTGMSPATAEAALRSLRVIQGDESRHPRLHGNAERLRTGLNRLGLSPRGYGPIVPLVIGDTERAIAVATSIRAAGIHVLPVRPPTVPAGTARLRLTTTALHSASDIDILLEAIERTLPWPTPSS
jgi:8-amino-7-oxononanoate synthase